MKKENFNKKIIEILSIKPIAFNPLLAKITGSVKAGLLLSQLLYWWNKGKKEEWIYKTIKEIEEETALSRYEQDGAIRQLKRLEIIEVKLMGVPPKRHFKLNLWKINKLICGKSTNQFVENQQINTENTTENTTDILDITYLARQGLAKKKIKDNLYKKYNTNLLLGFFKPINPSYERLFSNKTQREALERLVKKFGEDWVYELILRLPDIVSRPYAPRITTPYELEKKLGQLKVFLSQEKEKGGKWRVEKV